MSVKNKLIWPGACSGYDMGECQKVPGSMSCNYDYCPKKSVWNQAMISPFVSIATHRHVKICISDLHEHGIYTCGFCSIGQANYKDYTSNLVYSRRKERIDQCKGCVVRVQRGE